jgi:fumarate reductase subunit D
VLYRPRAFPAWLCIGMGGFLLALVAFLIFAAVAAPPAPEGEDASARVALAITALFVVVPAVFILRLGLNVRRMKVAIEADRVDVTVNQFKVWGFRRLASAQLAWAEIQGVQRYEIPNYAAPGGKQVDYILHTTKGQFAVPNIQFDRADEIAGAIASRIGRSVDDLPAGVTPVSATAPSDRRKVKAMRALGWISTVIGAVAIVIFGALAVTGNLSGSSLGALPAVCLGLLISGRSLRKFTLK